MNKHIYRKLGDRPRNCASNLHNIRLTLRIMRHFKMGALGTRPSFSGLEVCVSGCGFAQLPNHLTTEPPNQRLGTDPKFPVCVTLPRRSIVRERAGDAARAKRQGRCDGCIFMAGIISKNQSARQARRQRRYTIYCGDHVPFCVIIPSRS